MAARQPPKIPKGWHLLLVGTILQRGDMLRFDDNMKPEWETTLWKPGTVLTPEILKTNGVYIRRIKPMAKGLRTLKIKVGRMAFQFASLGDWERNAHRRFNQKGMHAADTIAIDNRGRVCNSGPEFIRAEKEKTFPIKFYRIE